MKNTNQRKLLVTFMLCFGLLSVFVGSASAQTDPSIRDWGSPPGSPPPWQTPDIWVDNDGLAPVNDTLEPSKGVSNRLFAKIRNLGKTPVPERTIRVRFAYAPYGVWGWASYADFKEIDAPIYPFELGPMGEATLEVAWDLSNLAENNGGLWGGHTVGEFDHFCVWVRIESTSDSNPSNNDARNNFTNVQTVLGASASIKFMVANPKNQDAMAELEIRGIPDDWKAVLEGIAEPRRFSLKAREFRVVTLTFTPPVRGPGGLPNGPYKQHVDISLMLDGNPVAIGGVSFDVNLTEKEPVRSFPPSGGTLSPYIIGTYDLRGGNRTVLQIVNPTGKFVRVLVAIFDDNEKPLKCVRDRLSPNDLLEIDVRRQLGNGGTGFGVVKVVSFNDREEVPEPGVVGYQRIFSKSFFHGDRLKTESALHQIPFEILRDDLKFILPACK